jgi:hypothetical protein
LCRHGRADFAENVRLQVKQADYSTASWLEYWVIVSLSMRLNIHNSEQLTRTAASNANSKIRFFVKNRPARFFSFDESVLLWCPWRRCLRLPEWLCDLL